MDAAVENARETFRESSWADMDGRLRGALLRNIELKIREHAGQLVPLEVADDSVNRFDEWRVFRVIPERHQVHLRRVISQRAQHLLPMHFRLAPHYLPAMFGCRAQLTEQARVRIERRIV